jgi:hypothetical protein
VEVLPEGGRELVDGFVPPSNPPLDCDGGANVSIVLPCQLGQAPVHELDCKLDSGDEGFAIYLFPDSGADPREPLDLTKYPRSPGGGFDSTILQGRVNVIEFHEQERTFLGELKDLTLSIGTPMGAKAPGPASGKTCRLKDGMLWAVPGGFL